MVDEVRENKAKDNHHPVKTRIQLSSLKTRHIEFIATETTYSSSSELLLNFRDVTYWIEREEKLKSMSRALEQSNDSIVITNHSGIIEYVNQAFEKFTGVRSKDIIGAQSSTLLKRTLDDEKDVRKVQEQLKKTARQSTEFSHEGKMTIVSFMKRKLSLLSGITEAR